VHGDTLRNRGLRLHDLDKSGDNDPGQLPILLRLHGVLSTCTVNPPPGDLADAAVADATYSVADLSKSTGMDCDMWKAASMVCPLGGRTLKADALRADEVCVAGRKGQLSAARPVAKSSGKKVRGWDSVFSRCANCGHEVHRGKERHMPWVHANTSPWCPQPFGR
jgi:hypothetical protein